MVIRKSGGGDPSVFHTVRQDFGRVREEAARTGWARSFARTFEDLEAFYLTEEKRRRLRGMGTVKRWFFLGWWLLRALFFKLTPPRRVALVAALILLTFTQQTVSFGRTRASFDLAIVGSITLLVLLMLELKDKLLARHELEAGRAVQMALLPETSPAIPGWDAWLLTRPANDVGGDLVDYLPLGGRRHAVSLADVAGKALPAALLMAKVQSTLRALVTEFDSLSELGGRVNRILCRDGLPDRFVTMIYLEVREGDGHVCMLNAGHMPPFILRPGTIEELPRGDLAMGLIDAATFAEQTADLNPGDLLLVYSDGVTEAMNAGGDFFGDERLRALLPGMTSMTPAEAGARVLNAVLQFVGEARPHDDLSLVILRRRANA